MFKNTDIDKLLKRIGRDDTLLLIVDEYIPEGFSWQEGNCWTFAKAVQRFFDCGELWAVAFRTRASRGQPMCSHVVLKIGDLYYDSLGARSEAEVVKDHDRDKPRAAFDSFLTPIYNTDTDCIVPFASNACIDRLVRRMYEILKETER